VIEGATPPHLVRLDREPGDVDWERLASEIQASAARDLVSNGLVIRTLALKALRRLPELGAEVGRSGGSSDPLEPRSIAVDAAARLAAVESRIDHTERTLGVLGAGMTRTARPAVRLPELPETPDYSPTGSDLPARPRRAPGSGSPTAGEGESSWMPSGEM